MPVDLAEALFESAELAASFRKEATKEEVLRKVSNNGVLKGLLRQSLSDTCSARKRTARDVLFQLLAYQRLVSRFCVASHMDLREKKAEVGQAKEKLLKRVDGSEELEMLWWRTRADISLLQFMEYEREEDEIVAEELSSLLSGVAAVQGYSAGENAETLTLFRNEIGDQVLREFLGYDSRRKDGSYVEGAIMSIARLDSWLVTVLHCLVGNEKRGEHRQKEYSDTYERMVDTTIKQLFGNVKEFLKHRSWEVVTIEGDRLGSEERREAVMEMLRTETNIWTLPSVRKTLISVYESWFRTYATDALGSVNVCYIGQDLDYGHIELLGAPTEKYEVCEQVE